MSLPNHSRKTRRILGQLYKDGLCSLEQAVRMLSLADAPEEEIERNRGLNKLSWGIMTWLAKKYKTTIKALRQAQVAGLFSERIRVTSVKTERASFLRL